MTFRLYNNSLRKMFRVRRSVLRVPCSAFGVRRFVLQVQCSVKWFLALGSCSLPLTPYLLPLAPYLLHLAPYLLPLTPYLLLLTLSSILIPHSYLVSINLILIPKLEEETG